MLLDISKKIEPAIATVLADLAELADESSIEFLVVGATARDIILGSGFGIDVGRATRDIDFGIRVANWDEFEQLAQMLENHDWRCPPRQRHRFVHEIGIPIDLIPFGGIESSTGSIRWPPHFNEALSVVGFADAFANKWQIRIRAAPSIEVSVASPAGQALLKMAAWHDRGFIRGRRDATDLRLLMERYLDLDNFDRIAKEHEDWLNDDFDYALASTKLLSVDVSKCVEHIRSDVFAALVESLRGGREDRSLAFSMHHVGDGMDLLHCQRLVEGFCSMLNRDGVG